VTGNGNGDYLGANIWNFGGETETNNGYTGTVTISSKCGAKPTGCSPSVLFEAPGNNGTYRNTWTGWYSTGNTVSSGNGKRAAYDTLAISGIRFSDVTGRFAEYDLGANYAGKTLQSIVSTCMGSNRNNNNSPAWKAGQCSNVGKLASSNGVSGVSQVLRIGVGDGSADGVDWALFMPVTGNGNGDYLGANIWNFGGEMETNNGYTGKVTISSKCAAPGACSPTVLFEALGNSGTYRNTWTGWYSTQTQLFTRQNSSETYFNSSLISLLILLILILIHLLPSN
jgi:hypothetical protein